MLTMIILWMFCWPTVGYQGHISVLFLFNMKHKFKKNTKNTRKHTESVNNSQALLLKNDVFSLSTCESMTSSYIIIFKHYDFISEEHSVLGGGCLRGFFG